MSLTISFFVPAPSAFEVKYLDHLVAALPRQTSVRVYTSGLSWTGDMQFTRTLFEGQLDVEVDDSLEYLWKGSSNRLFQRFLDDCELHVVDLAAILRLSHHEFFLAELEARPELRASFRFGLFGMSDLAVSRARVATMKRLICDRRVSRLIFHSIAGNESVAPKDAAQILRKHEDKVKVTFDPIYDGRETYSTITQRAARIRYGLDPKSRVVLFFGSMFFGKGVDFLAPALERLPPGYHLLVTGPSSTLNFPFDLEQLTGNPRITWIDDFVPQDQISVPFAACDVVALPYRRTYEYDTSGVLVQAALAGRPVVGPNIEPFSRTIKDFGLGEVFEPENPSSIASAIEKAVERDPEEVSIATSSYIDRIESWGELARIWIG